MPKRAAGLSVRRIQAEERPGLYADGGGLYLQVAGRSKTWVFRFQIAGRRRDRGLGPSADFPRSGARRRATELRQLVRDGIDPIEQRAARRSSAGLAARRAMSFRQCAEAYIEAHRAGWRNSKHAAQWPST